MWATRHFLGVIACLYNDASGRLRETASTCFNGAFVGTQSALNLLSPGCRRLSETVGPGLSQFAAEGTNETRQSIAHYCPLLLITHLVTFPTPQIPRVGSAAFCTCTHHNPSFKLAAWLPRLCRAPSQPARHHGLNVTAPPLRLSGDSPDSRSGDADKA